MQRNVLPDPLLVLKFLLQPPETIFSGSPFPETVNVRFDPYTCYHYTPSGSTTAAAGEDSANAPFTRYSPWILGPRESLRFKAEFITVLGPSAPRDVPPLPSNRIDISNEQIRNGTRNLIFTPSAVAVPGLYQLQVSVYVRGRSRGKARATPIALTVSDDIQVISLESSQTEVVTSRDDLQVANLPVASVLRPSSTSVEPSHDFANPQRPSARSNKPRFRGKMQIANVMALLVSRASSSLLL
jgi:hypothetical protein